MECCEKYNLISINCKYPCSEINYGTLIWKTQAHVCDKSVLIINKKP